MVDTGIEGRFATLAGASIDPILRETVEALTAAMYEAAAKAPLEGEHAHYAEVDVLAPVRAGLADAFRAGFDAGLVEAIAQAVEQGSPVDIARLERST